MPCQFQSARDLHRSVPAERWCITRSEFEDFVKEVHRRWESNQIPCSEPRNSLHWDPGHGPNLYDVNSYVVKPVTLKAGGASYALMKHPEGLECEVFVSHSWHGGIFHLGRGIHAAWPQLYQRHNLYCCLLSNPQNLDLDEFIGGNLAESAFALALQKASHLLVVPNPSNGIYSRLWCVFEAYLGAKWNKIYLLPVVPDRKETCKYWFREVGVIMLYGLLAAVPVWWSLEFFDGRSSGLYSWLELIYRVLSLLALLIVVPCWHHSWSLDMMRALTFIGCVFFLMDVYWGSVATSRDGYSWVSVFLHYGWFSNLTLTNASVTVLLVLLKSEKAGFEEQKEMMQFHSLRDSHCSKFEDEQRIRQAIAGAEDEVETAINILLTAGAYTDNLRHSWENGLNIERAGMTDVKTGVLFSMLAWLITALDLLSDTNVGHLAHRRYFGYLCLLYTVSVFVIPLSVWRLEKQGPDTAVFTLQTWGLWGMLCLQVPILLCFLQGYDEVENAQLLDFFDQRVLATLDDQTWAASERFPIHISRTVLVARLLCMISAWTIVGMRVDCWNRLRIWLSQTARCRDNASSGQDSDDAEQSSLLELEHGSRGQASS